MTRLAVRIDADTRTPYEIKSSPRAAPSVLGLSARTRAAVGRGLRRRHAFHAAQELLFGDHVDLRVAGLIVAAEHRAAILRQRRGGGLLGLVHLDVLLDGMDQAFAQVVWRNGRVGDLAQRDHRVLVVVRLDRQMCAVGNRTRPMGREQHQLETVGNLVDAVFDGHARHATVPLVAKRYTRKRPRNSEWSEARRQLNSLSHVLVAESRACRTLARVSGR